MLDRQKVKEQLSEIEVLLRKLIASMEEMPEPEPEDRVAELAARCRKGMAMLKEKNKLSPTQERFYEEDVKTALRERNEQFLEKILSHLRELYKGAAV